MRLIAGFDLETTGLLAPEHRICEIALLLYDVDTEQRVGSLIRRFNPGRPIDPEAQAVHGITFEELAHHPLLEDSADTLDKIEKIARASQCWVAHNGDGFDMPFIAQEFVRVGRTLPMIKSFDTMLQGRWASPAGCHTTRRSHTLRSTT
jgi:DNA polymerase-3 subunit epsilon